MYYLVFLQKTENSDQEIFSCTEENKSISCRRKTKVINFMFNSQINKREIDSELTDLNFGV